MRALLSLQAKRRLRSDRGAIGVMTVAVTFMLMIVSAFAVDMGIAYNSKRQLQTAADSAVLAAGAVTRSTPARAPTWTRTRRT